MYLPKIIFGVGDCVQQAVPGWMGQLLAGGSMRGGLGAAVSPWERNEGLALTLSSFLAAEGCRKGLRLQAVRG